LCERGGASAEAEKHLRLVVAEERGHEEAGAQLLGLLLRQGRRAEGLEGLGTALCALGQTARVVRLLGAATALREAIGAPMPLCDRARQTRSRDQARATLGEAAFGAAWAEGQALSLDEAATLAWQDDQPGQPRPAAHLSL
jgi:hypothetical protein